MSKESNFKLHVTLVEDAIKTLCEEIHSYSPTLFKIWNNIDEFIAIVENEPDTSLFTILRYSSIPTPTANLSIKIDEKLRTINRRASIPFILFEQPQEIRLLENYDASNIKYSNRLNKTKYKPLISEINLDVLRKNN